ncbi:protein claret segregational-like [Sitodiplosis mosellana]|uniref:protein claret segregational-like n=1 Tax=Sitodiplosis mosellana TaxID=263140 RepID=UPI00244499F9|nr:protein claret segregational-like [Sitodiplosis mosellana]
MAQNIQIPQFWELIEKSLSINPEGIQEIKEILTVFKYTTIESIVKFVKRKEISMIELEFLNRKTELIEKYPHLQNFTFASGVYSILSDIALKIKKNYVQERNDIDLEQVLEKVVTDARKKVIEQYTATSSSVDSKWKKSLEDEVKMVRGQLRSSQMERRNLLHALLDLQGKVRVMARLCPAKCLSAKIQYQINSNQTKLKLLKNGEQKDFKFDYIFDDGKNQADVLEFINPLIKSAQDGYNVCVLVYGQTGSGKTFTMIGSDSEPGIIPRPASQITFLSNELLSSRESKASGWNYSVEVSVLEIYNDTMYDLLDDTNKPTVSYGSQIQNLTKAKASNEEQLKGIWSKGVKSRRVETTTGNDFSSRSHAITQFHLTGEHSDGSMRTSTINLVDLAGSESATDSQNMNETRAINSSLSALNGVFAGLRKNTPIDFTQCLLTKILKPCFIDDSKTLLIANLSTDQHNYSATVNTSRFANCK